MNEMTDVVQKLWGFCHTLRHDGIDYGDYIEQITFLLFLKMADERELALPKGCDWGKLRDKSGTALLEHYPDVLRTLGKTPGILGDIYAEAQSRFNNAVNLKRLINLIDTVRNESMEYVGLTTSFRDMNLLDDSDPEDLIYFVRVSSEFYPQLEEHYVAESREWLKKVKARREAEGAK